MSDRIEVFADVWCPFTHVGLRMVLEARSKAGREDMAVVVRAWPLELVNGAPMDPHKTGANAAALREQLVPGMFANVDAPTFPTSTLDALDLVSRAYALSAGAGEQASPSLRLSRDEQSALHVSADASRLQQFLDECFAA